MKSFLKAATVAVFFIFQCVISRDVASENINHDQQPIEDSYQLIKNFSHQERAQRYEKTRHSVKNTYKNIVISENDHAWKELDMDLLIEKLDKTYTAAGSVEFKKIMHPTHDVHQLLYRQELIKNLIQDEALFYQLDTCIKTFANEYENDFVNIFEHINFDPFEMARKNVLLPVTSSTKINLLIQLSMMLFGAGQGLAYDVFHVTQDAQQLRQAGWGMRTWLTINGLGVVAALGYGMYLNGAAIKNMLSQIPQADHFILHVAQGINLVSSMHHALERSDSVIATALPAQLLSSVFSIESSSNFASITEQLLNREQIEVASKDSYIATASKYWSMPDSFDLYYQIKMAKNSFEKILCAIGTLDAYLAIARLYKEWQNQNIPITFAHYKKSCNPQHDFKELYNSLIDESIANDFILGKQQKDSSYVARHGLLTGPHACGKTMSMKTLAYGYILGQTITIIPAKQALFVPITKLKTYFNIGDNLTEGLSSFAAENERLGLLMDDGLSLKHGDICLMLVDEPLAKTIQIIGEPRVSDFMRKLFPIDQLMIILATHFEDPARLEAETNGIIKNFQPEVIQLDQNKFEPTYKIIDGKAQWWFNDKIKREAFVEWLLNQ